MSLNLENLVAMKPIPGIIIRDAQTGNPGLARIRADAVVNDAGQNIQVELAAAIATAVALLKDGNDGSTLPSTANSLKKLSDSLEAVRTSLELFLTSATDNSTIDTLSELVQAISANKTTIDALLSSKIDVTAIVNDLTSEDPAKVLSAAQGKALKSLLDTLETTVNQSLAGLHIHTNQAEVLDNLSSSDGKLLFNSKAVGESLPWVGISTAVPTEWPATLHPDGVLFLIPAE